MKKILSLIFFVFTLVWTWNLIHSATSVGFETHSGIQQRLTEMIEASLKKARPEAQNLEIFKLWTETLNNNKVRAVFAYKFSDKSEGGEVVEQTVAGEAVLYREPSEVENEDLWILQSVKTTNDSLIFAEGSLVTPDMNIEVGGEATPPASTETQDPAPEAAPAQN